MPFTPWAPLASLADLVLLIVRVVTGAVMVYYGWPKILDPSRHVREFEENEKALWPAMLRRAALRTWLGRLGYTHFPQEGEITHAKDFRFSENLLRHHIQHAKPLK